MKIGVFVSVVAGQKGFESNVSGHIQVPLHGIEELRKAGHEVHLITNEFGEDRSLPFCLAEDLNVHLVTDSRNRGGILERTSNQGSGVKIFQLLKQVREIKRICKEQEFDVLHLFGFNRTAHLAGGLKLLGLKTPVVVTIFGTFFPERGSFITKKLWKRVDATVTATSFVKTSLEREGISATQVRHGIIRNLVEELGDSKVEVKHRVLFWRDLTIENGADVAMATYENLAEKYPDVSFDLAVRKHWDPINGIEESASNYSNINVFHFPYKNGITLPKLLLESVCVVMPIREMSIDPQLVIAETLAAGIPIITTNQRSNPEFVVDGETGFLTELGDVEGTTKALDTMLQDREAAATMGVRSKKHIEENWNWNHYVNDLEEVYARVIAP